MKKIIILLFICFSFSAIAQIDTKPGGSTYQLQAPKNMTSWYNPADSSMWFVHEGKWHKMAGATKKYSIWQHQYITNSEWSISKVLGFDSNGNLIPVSAGNVIGPATNTNGYIPIWNGANSKTLANGIADNSSNWNTVINRKLISDSTATDGYTRRDRLASQIATREPKITKGTTAQYFRGDMSLATFPKDTLFTTIAISDETTALTAGTSKRTFRMPIGCTITKVRSNVVTAPTGSTLIVDINESGTSILSTKLSIDASEKTSKTAASAAVISDATIANDAEMTIDIDQVGSTIAGAGLKLTIYYLRN